jgi:hypothetical protein
MCCDFERLRRKCESRKRLFPEIPSFVSGIVLELPGTEEGSEKFIWDLNYLKRGDE